jgi:hypothetical protein
VRLNDDQATKLHAVYGQRHESPEEWGVHSGSFVSLDVDVFCEKLVRTVIEAFTETVAAFERDVRKLQPGDSPMTKAWREGVEQANAARAQWPKAERAELERREAEQWAAHGNYERDVLRQVALYGGLADWPLLENLVKQRYPLNVASASEQ